MIMGTPWSAKLCTVKVARTKTPKPVTIIVPFYQNRQFLLRQLDHWLQFPAEVRTYLRAIIVDDGSPDPAESVLRGRTVWPFPVRLFRIEEDRRWNWLAARNRGAHEAADGWLLLTDMDHVIPASTAYSVVYGQHDQKVIYGFSRKESTGANITPHCNSWLMTKAMFWTVGGYDERMSGYYGSDGYWRRRCASTAPMQILSDDLVRYEYDGDSSTTTYKRKEPRDAELRRMVATFKPGSKPTHLTFPAHEVAL